jgi:hypothetical protein
MSELATDGKTEAIVQPTPWVCAAMMILFDC